MTNLPGLFVVGTDTGVGKTRVASAIAGVWHKDGRRVGVLKPVATGAERRDGEWSSGDAEALIAAIGGGVPLDRAVPLLFEEPLAPPVAARRAGSLLAWDEVRGAAAEALAWWSDRADVMVVEGVGGLLCPLAEGATIADLAIALDYPLVIVAHRGLGTISHTLLTVEAALARGLRVAGVLLNGARPTIDPVAEATNAEELSRRLGGVAILGEWGHEAGGEFGLPAAVVAEVSTWYDRAMTSRSPDHAHAWRVVRPRERPMSSEDLRAADDAPFPGEIPPVPIIGDADPGLAPLLAPGSRDDSFRDSPNSRRVAPDLVDSGGDLPGLGTGDLLAAIDTNPAPRSTALGRPTDEGEEGEDEHGHEHGAKTSWPMLLLGSYASAVTLALAWALVMLGQRERGPADVAVAPAAPVEARPEAPRGRKVEPVAAVPDDRMARFGETLRVGSLEVTPLDARRQPVTLRRLDLAGKAVERKGAAGTIVLRVRLHNDSTDLSYAPIDPAFVRQRGQEAPDCFAETSEGERIYPYPLAMESELGIVGQEFGELRPGESRIVSIATAPDAPPVDPNTLTWRLRLRTGLDRIEAIGVRPSVAKPKAVARPD